MNSTLKNVLAVVAGLLLGGVVNMSLIMASPHLIPPPPGADVTTQEGLKAAMHLFTPINFLMPFLAHALGTLVGALVAARLAATNKMRIALGIAFFSLLGGATDVYLLPSPLWFSVTDLVLAYLPMGYLAGWMVSRKRS